MMKVVLITGASSGFGRLLVPAFLARGWTVIATMRNAARGEDLFRDEGRAYPERLAILSLDVTSEADREAAAAFLAERFGGRLDCLINNAGFGQFGALEEISEAGIRAQMEVNFFGLTFLTRTLLPALRAARGRIVNVSSVLGYMGMPLASMYCAGKHAVEGLSESLAYELAPHGVQVAIVEPGAFRTDFASKQQWGDAPLPSPSPYAAQTRGFRAFRERRTAGPGNPPAPVIDAIVRLAECERMPLRVRCGKDARAAAWAKRLLPAPLQRAIFGAVYRRAFEAGGE